jgi:hypothetical protein
LLHITSRSDNRQTTLLFPITASIRRRDSTVSLVSGMESTSDGRLGELVRIGNLICASAMSELLKNSSSVSRQRRPPLVAA